MPNGNDNGTKLWIYEHALKIIGALLMLVIVLATYTVRGGIDENKAAIKENLRNKVDCAMYERDRREVLNRLSSIDGKVDRLVGAVIKNRNNPILE